ncbi:MAG: MBL fold metallo-hydrolase [Spirochaetales bacterium]|nr:MBL fold metallo-hydrolase [Spirochaetales bacterium]
MKLHFYGAARTVTGSLHGVEVNGERILLDCGLYQGHREEALKRNRTLPDWAIAAGHLILSHAHVDHCGNIPGLVKQGFTGNIYSTAPTRDLAALMLQDSAHIHEQDAKFLSRRRRKAGHNGEIKPLYTLGDALRSLEHFITLPYHRPFRLASGVHFTFFDAGHILGAAMVLLEVQENGKKARLLFSGDLGRRNMPILRDPEIVSDVDYLILESTYGNRKHNDRDLMDEALAGEVDRILQTGGKLYIPSFSLERAQEILLSIHKLEAQNRIPVLPVYLDSPLASAITDVFRLHPECFDEELLRMLNRKDLPFFTQNLVRVRSADESREVMVRKESAIVIAGSGMCEFGRIVHHLSYGLSSPANTVAIVGFQAANTLGRKLLDNVNPVRIFGDDVAVRARIVALDGFSAHADLPELLWFVKEIRSRGYLKKVFLVHGEDRALMNLKQELKQTGLESVEVPEQDSMYDLNA